MLFAVVGVVAIILAIAAAISGLAISRRILSLSSLRENHPVGAVFLSVVGTSYGVLVAFVASVVWSQYEETRGAVAKEANGLAVLVQIATAAPPAEGRLLREAILRYGRHVLDVEWPAMASGAFDRSRTPEFDELFRAVMALPSSTARDAALFETALDRLETIGDSRRVRVAASRETLPLSLWVALVGGGAQVVIFTYFFGHHSLRSQAVMTALLTGMIGWLLFVIVQLDNPFGNVTPLSPAPIAAVIDGAR